MARMFLLLVLLSSCSFLVAGDYKRPLKPVKLRSYVLEPLAYVPKLKSKERQNIWQLLVELVLLRKIPEKICEHLKCMKISEADLKKFEKDVNERYADKMEELCNDWERASTIIFKIKVQLDYTESLFKFGVCQKEWLRVHHMIPEIRVDKYLKNVVCFIHDKYRQFYCAKSMDYVWNDLRLSVMPEVEELFSVAELQGMAKLQAVVKGKDMRQCFL